MKINEISGSHLVELDVFGGASTLANAVTSFAKSYTTSGDPGQDAKDFGNVLPDGERSNYNNKMYYYDQQTKSWYEQDTDTKAGLLAQRALMKQYGFTLTGKPTIALRQKLERQKRRKARGISADKVFKPAAVAKIVNAFQTSMTEYSSTNDLTRYLNNAEFLAKYIDQGYDLKLLKSHMAPFFASGVASNPADAAILADINNHLFINPDEAKIAALKQTYTTTAGAGTKRLSPTDDTNLKNIIATTVSRFDATSSANMPTHLNSIKSAGYDITDYTNLVQTEAAKIVRKSHTYRTINDMTAFLDTMIALKPMLPSVPTTFGSKLNSLNFMAMFPGIGVRDLTTLRQKRTMLLTP